MASSPGANGPLGDTLGLCVRSASGRDTALPPRALIEYSPHSRADRARGLLTGRVHRWRRPILHVIAGVAIVGSGALGALRTPAPERGQPQFVALTSDAPV